MCVDKAENEVTTKAGIAVISLTQIDKDPFD